MVVEAIKTFSWPTTWVDWCAVAGFVISVALTVREILKSRTSIALTDIRAYVYPAYQYRTGNFCVLRGIIQNRSLASVSVCSLALVDDIGKHHTSFIEPHLLFTSTRNWGDKRTTSAFTTAFPMNLSPYESRSVTILFYVEDKRIQPPWLPERTVLDTGESLPEALRERLCPPKDRPPKPLEQRKLLVRVNTSRKSKDYTIQVDTYPAVQLLYEMPDEGDR